MVKMTAAEMNEVTYQNQLSKRFVMENAAKNAESLPEEKEKPIYRSTPSTEPILATLPRRIKEQCEIESRR